MKLHLDVNGSMAPFLSHPQRQARPKPRQCGVSVSAGMEPFSRRQRAVPHSNQSIFGCMLPLQQPGRPDSMQPRDRSNGNGTVLVEQPDATLQHVGREALQHARTEYYSQCMLPTETSPKLRLRAYRHSADDGRSISEPTAIISGDPEGQSEVLVRVHDACWTSEVLGSLKCDCAQQLKLALETIAEKPPGIVIYLQQEGRGIGLANKIAAYGLQDQGYDTVDANRALGYPDDCREYTSVHNILQELNVKSIQLMTNNPRKLSVLQALGVKVTKRVPCVVAPQKYNQGYLDTKRSKMSHVYDDDQFDGSFCFLEHDGEPLPLTSVDLTASPPLTENGSKPVSGGSSTGDGSSGSGGTAADGSGGSPGPGGLLT